MRNIDPSHFAAPPPRVPAPIGMPALRFAAIASVFLCLAPLRGAIFYDYDIVAQSGTNGLAALKNEVSINDNGSIAFIGYSDVGNSLWYAGPSDTSARSINPGFASSTRDFAFPQINNSEHIVARDRASGSPPSTRIRVWHPTQTLRLIDFPTDGDSVTLPSISNSGDVAYVRLDIPAVGPDSTLIKLNGNGTTLASFPGTLTFRPQAGNGGRVVLRGGNQPTSPVHLYSPAGPESIAPGFAAYGQSPGISDSGEVVAFYGERSETIEDLSSKPPQTSQHQLPGIFISVKESGSWSVHRVAGFWGELGESISSTGIDFQSFEKDARVGVAHAALGPAGLEGDGIVVVFMATPTTSSPSGLFTASKGIWSARGIIQRDPANPAGPLVYVPRSLMLVAQVGDEDVVPGEKITDFFLYDPVALAATGRSGSPRVSQPGEHRVAFAAAAGGAQYVVRAHYFDTDQDALPNHWETRTGANAVRLNGHALDLPAMGASPARKDIFVHADWLPSDPAKPGYFYYPARESMVRVANAFARRGIALHVDFGAGFPMNHPDHPGATWGSFSQARQLPAYSPRFKLWDDVDGAKAASLVRAGRRPAFFYALFGNEYDLFPGSTGYARGIPGPDFVVTSNPLPLLPSLGEVLNQAGTFMHELGHCLGLQHGGDDELNAKPNYLSVMNYRFQLTGLLRRDGRSELDYSGRKLPSLDENALSEFTDIGDPERYTLWHGDRSAAPKSADPFYHMGQGVFALFGTDWNLNGNRELSPVSGNVNDDGDVDSNRNGILTSNYFDVLHGAEDWSRVQFTGGGYIGGVGPAGGNPTYRFAGAERALLPPPSEASKDELVKLASEAMQAAQDLAPVDRPRLSPRSGPAPFVVEFDASESYSPVGAQITSYRWSFGDGSVTNAVRGQHVYSTPGEYVVRLELTDDRGFTNLMPEEVRIVVEPGSRLAGDVDGDADVDRDDLSLVVAARNQTAAGPDDSRDLNRDGRIDAVDARLLATKFTRPGGATQ